MFGFGKTKNEIDVEFFEGAASEPFAASKLPIDDLPDTFEIDTRFSISGDDWRVTKAAPLTKSEFRKTGKLKLYLAKYEVKQIDPNEILLTLPTIGDALPDMENAASLENALVVWEDDWRQCEFLSDDYSDAINEEFDAIEAIFDNHREGHGFNKLHARELIKTPFREKEISSEQLKHAFSIEKTYANVAFSSAAAALTNGFAFETKSGWVLWGKLDQAGNIDVLNLGQTERSDIDAISAEIDLFLSENGLFLIDWSILFWGGEGKNSFAEYGDED